MSVCCVTTVSGCRCSEPVSPSLLPYSPSPAAASNPRAEVPGLEPCSGTSLHACILAPTNRRFPHSYYSQTNMIFDSMTEVVFRNQDRVMEASKGVALDHNSRQLIQHQLDRVGTKVRLNCQKVESGQACNKHDQAFVP